MRIVYIILIIFFNLNYCFSQTFDTRYTLINEVFNINDLKEIRNTCDWTLYTVYDGLRDYEHASIKKTISKNGNYKVVYGSTTYYFSNQDKLLKKIEYYNRRKGEHKTTIYSKSFEKDSLYTEFRVIGNKTYRTFKSFYLNQIGEFQKIEETQYINDSIFLISYTYNYLYPDKNTKVEHKKVKDYSDYTQQKYPQFIHDITLRTQFGDHGNFKQYRSIDGESESIFQETRYNKSGQIVYLNDKSMSGIIEYEHDGEGKLIKKTQILSAARETKYSYDIAKNIDKVVEIDFYIDIDNNVQPLYKNSIILDYEYLNEKYSWERCNIKTKLSKYHQGRYIARDSMKMKVIQKTCK